MANKNTSADSQFRKIEEAYALLSKIRRSQISEDKEKLETSPDVLIQVAAKVRDFDNEFMDSKIAFSIDRDVFETRKIDFQKMQIIMSRIIDCGKAIKHLDLMIVSFKEYKLLCEEKGFTKGIEKAEILLRLIDFEKTNFENEAKELSVQVENVNLYYQNFIVTRATRVAYVSLGFASLAFLLTIIQTLVMLHII